MFSLVYKQDPLKQLSMQLSLSTSKIRVAVVVSNDYDNNESGLLKLSGTHKDAEKMLATFTELGYAVCHCKNMKIDELTDIVKHIAALLASLSCIKLVVVFSGYGRTNQHYRCYKLPLYAQDGRTIIGEVQLLDFFASLKCPQLFFFNVCEDSYNKQGWFTHDFFPKKDNTLVACSILPFKELKSGSLWVELLAEKILTQSKDITILLSDVNNRMNELYSSLRLFEPPRFDSMLKGSVNFLGESLSGNVIEVCLCCNYIMAEQ